MILSSASGGSGGGAQQFQALCLSGLLVGDTVYVDGVIGSVPDVRKTTIDDVDVTKAISIGVVAAKPGATDCTIQTIGQLVGVYAGLTPGQHLFVGTDSRLTATPPVSPVAGTRYAQKGGYALTTDTVLVDFDVIGKLQAA